MVIFKDTKNRKIEIAVDCVTATASHNGKQIGIVETTGLIEADKRSPFQPAEIIGWNVDSNYQRAGIATEMVKLLFEELGEMIPPKFNMGIGGQNTLTDEGLAITIHCQQLGYIYPFPEEQ